MADDPKHILSAAEVQEQMEKALTEDIADKVIKDIPNFETIMRTIAELGSSIISTGISAGVFDKEMIEQQIIQDCVFNVGETVQCRSSRGKGNIKRLTQGKLYEVKATGGSTIRVINDRGMEDDYSVHHFIQYKDEVSENFLSELSKII